jgi:exopolysaccharide production protein ExoZ
MAQQVGVVRNIQVLRAIAALLVVFVHLDRMLLWLGLPVFGGAGVDIFFVISGFIMVYTTSGRNDVTSWSFMTDRIVRIVPIYWVITMTVFGVALLAPALLQGTSSDWVELLKSLFFIPFTKANGLVAPVMFVGWSLNYEMFFYLLFAIGLLLPNREWGVMAVIACLLSLVGLGLLGQPQDVISRFYTSIIMLNFALGMLIGILYRRIPAAVPAFLRLTTAVAVLASGGVAVLLPLAYPKAQSFLVSGLPASVAVAGALALERWGWVLTNRWCLLLGNASYSIYLIHPFVTQAVQKIAAGLPHRGWTAAAMIAVALATVCLAGVSSYRLFEQPLSRFLRGRLKARRLNPHMGRAIV